MVADLDRRSSIPAIHRLQFKGEFGPRRSSQAWLASGVPLSMVNSCWRRTTDDCNNERGNSLAGVRRDSASLLIRSTEDSRPTMENAMEVNS